MLELTGALGFIVFTGALVIIIGLILAVFQLNSRMGTLLKTQRTMLIVSLADNQQVTKDVLEGLVVEKVLTEDEAKWIYARRAGMSSR
jgi:hypothetical protein